MTDVAQILCCPRCHSQLDLAGMHTEYLYCPNQECTYSQEGFLVLAGQPVLVDFAKTILSREDLLARSGQSYKIRDDDRTCFKTRILELLFGTNSVARACCTRFLRELKTNSVSPRILVIGGGAIGSGADDLYHDKSIDLVGTDIYVSRYTKVVADGHQLPFIDQCFDGVLDSSGFGTCA
jgi:hypothetical protein